MLIFNEVNITLYATSFVLLGIAGAAVYEIWSNSGLQKLKKFNTMTRGHAVTIHQSEQAKSINSSSVDNPNSNVVNTTLKYGSKDPHGHKILQMQHNQSSVVNQRHASLNLSKPKTSAVPISQKPHVHTVFSLGKSKLPNSQATDEIFSK